MATSMAPESWRGGKAKRLDLTPFLLVLACVGPLLAEEKADRIFLNGRVWTGDPARPRAEALAVRGPRILAVGTTAEIRRQAEKGTKVVHLKGGFVVPGFIDAHQHFISGSLSMERLELAGCDRLEVLQERLASYARSRPEAPWIVGRGWGYADFPEQTPHRSHIDAVVGDRPVFLRDRDGHAALANTRALALAGITLTTQDPEGGVIERDASGEPTGLLDGTVDSKTAWMFEPYVGGGTGLPEWSVEELEQSVLAYDREGWQVQIHAIGDRAIAATLDAYERAARINGTRGRRHRVEHIEVPRLVDLPRFKALDVMASTQALFALPDKTTLENYSVLLGPERDARANAFRLFDDAGAVQAFGSDWPVFPNDVLLGIFVAATRQNPDGTPAGGWHPEARIRVEAALRHFTADAAHAAHEETVKGILKPGFLGDFTVLSDDILAIAPAAIPKTRVLRTVVGGHDTFVAGGP